MSPQTPPLPHQKGRTKPQEKTRDPGISIRLAWKGFGLALPEGNHVSGSPTASTGGEAIRTGVSVARQKKGVGEGGRRKEQSKQFLGGHAFGDPPTGVSQGRLVTMGEDPERKIKDRGGEGEGRCRS